MTSNLVDYVALLTHSYAMEQQLTDNPPMSRLQYLSREIFDFTTYDADLDELLATKAVEVCAAITQRRTFDYITDPDNYRWYILMCNLPFFADRLDWGTSIRGAWWTFTDDIPYESSGLWVGTEQRVSWTFRADAWRQFIEAVLAFARGEE